MNPWLEIPLSDLEGHMASPLVAQAQLIGDVFEKILKEHQPQSVAVLGCAGGSGFERISADVTRRVVGIDLNPQYLEAARSRFMGKFESFELLAVDIQTGEIHFEPVDLIYAALIFEYVDPVVTLKKIKPLMTPSGSLGTFIQLPQPSVTKVTDTPFMSLQKLSSVMQLLKAEDLQIAAEQAGFKQVSSQRVETPAGKQFQVQMFRLAE